jgi:hypothetical protein
MLFEDFLPARDPGLRAPPESPCLILYEARIACREAISSIGENMAGVSGSNQRGEPFPVAAIFSASAGLVATWFM